ncbi:uncharacterized protein M6B38_382945 [Iris pallida]|uniref:Uncharacterized protein n=1 Tax=Iris pallida TaxID=29817 RepID=A0AAX6G5D2_IRIPA|nr:uncharacterized protein M6B38_146400 [Iris pallida]KAJ6823528.1 uncharacterized protein M6B38_382945 [Iris pallida]
MNQLKPQIHTRTTMISPQAKLKGSLSKNHLMITYSMSRCNDSTKSLSFGQKKSEERKIVCFIKYLSDIFF